MLIVLVLRKHRHASLGRGTRTRSGAPLHVFCSEGRPRSKCSVLFAAMRAEDEPCYRERAGRRMPRPEPRLRLPFNAGCGSTSPDSNSAVYATSAGGRQQLLCKRTFGRTRQGNATRETCERPQGPYGYSAKSVRVWHGNAVNG